MTEPTTTAEKWTTGAQVTLAGFVFTVLVTLLGLAYNLGGQSKRIDGLEQKIQSMQTVPDRMTRLEILTEETNRNVTEIKGTMRDMQRESRTGSHQ